MARNNKTISIYFAGSIRGGRADQALYGELISYLNRYGTILTEHVGDDQLTEIGEEGMTDKWIFERDMDWIRSADVLIAEVTAPSLGVGYEIGNAEALGKPILCLFRPQQDRALSAMIAGNKNLPVREYQTLKEATRHIDAFLDRLNIKQSD